MLTLQLRTTEVLQDLLPIRRVVVSAQVRLQLAAENLQRSTLANTVRSNKTKDLAGTRHRQPVQLKAVRRVSMRDLSVQVCRQVDDVDRVERAFLRADTAPYTQALGDEGDFRRWVDLDAQLASANDGASFLAFLPAFLGQSQRRLRRVAWCVRTLGLHCMRHLQLACENIQNSATAGLAGLCAA